MKQLYQDTVIAIRAMAIFGVAILGLSVAKADTLPPTVLVNSNVMVAQPSAPVSTTLDLLTPGRLTVTVTDLLWPQALQSLSFAISDHDSVLVQRIGSGSLIYDIASAGNYFANVYATPNMLSGAGLYHLNVTFAPSVVPLPAAIWLLLSGVGGLVGLSRKRPAMHAPVTQAVVQ